MSEPVLLWQMGKWRVEQHSHGLLVRKLNVYGAAIRTLGPYTGHDAKKRAVADAKREYAKEATQ